MAGIDKIYGTLKQYDEFHKWCSGHNAGLHRWFYPRRLPEVDEKEYEGQVMITNFTERADAWLVRNCDLEWVVAFITDQYGGKDPYDPNPCKDCMWYPYEQRCGDLEPINELEYEEESS